MLVRHKDTIFKSMFAHCSKGATVAHQEHAQLTIVAHFSHNPVVFAKERSIATRF